MRFAVFLLTSASFLSATAGLALQTQTLKNNSQVSGSLILKTDKDKLSYSMGAVMAQNVAGKDLIDSNLFLRGFQDGLTGNVMLIKENIEAILKKETTGANKQEEGRFLGNNKLRPGVATTASGLQYKILDPGKGLTPADRDIVTVEYVGQLINGQIIDRSPKPIRLAVSEVIPGWSEALKLMKPGAHFELCIPSSLAYGERGYGNAIGPNQTLLFDVHLLAVEKPAVS